jgi:two-component system, OmpR family, sensor histidine kinase KdpD
MTKGLHSPSTSRDFSTLAKATARLAAEVAIASAAIAIVTAICFFVHLNYLIPSFLYLLILVFLSLRTRYLSAAIVSFIAATCLLYFFIPPVLEWRINDPEDGFALLAYLVTSLVITRLAASARSQTRIAEACRKDVVRLYETASQLLSLNPEVAAGPQALRIFREGFGLNAACLFDATTSVMQVDGESVHDLVQVSRDAAEHLYEFKDAEGWLHVHRFHIDGKLAGTVGFEGRFDDEAATGPLFALAATAFERALSFRNASMAAAAAQAEMLRSAILDAFAHEFKTPQAVIMAAAGSLRETGGLRAEQMEMTDVIENEIWRMTRLTTRLLRMARIDRDEVKPNMEITGLDSLLTHLVRQFRGSSAGHCEISMKIPQDVPNVLIDSELMNLAFVQLLDNACKYSTPGTPVIVEVNCGEEFADIFVRNEGGFIRNDERERVFERFYRGVKTEATASGAGLGLYVARKIARAHGGDLDLDQARSVNGSTTFRMWLPVIRVREESYQ